MAKLKPGAVAARMQFRNSILRQLEKEDRQLFKVLLESVSPKMRQLFEADPDILNSLLETGSCDRWYQEPKGVMRDIYPRASVLRSRLRTLRKRWAGLIRISISKSKGSGYRVQFTVIAAPLK